MAKDVSKPTRAAAPRGLTTSPTFARRFRDDPAAALRSKGLAISDTEARRLAEKVRGLAGRPGRPGADAAEVEVEVTVKVKF